MATDQDTKVSSMSEDHEDNTGEDSDVNHKNILKLLNMAPPVLHPPAVKRRIKALKKIQLESLLNEAKFFEEVHALEMKYLELYKPQYAKRAQILSGAYEPNDEECDFESEKEDDEEGLAKDTDKKLNIKELKAQEEANDVKGIPDFWLTIFNNVSLLQEMVEEHDVPILKHLQDITLEFAKSPMGFTLFFHFSPNEFFTNTVLTKEYELKCTPDEGSPFTFEGPEIIKCKGCTIDWAKGKNVTIKTVKKKQKHKGRGEVRTVTKTVRRDSFFNFFNPPTVSEDPDAEVDEDVQNLLTADFEIGHYIRERIVPRAVLYFTGEAMDEDDDDYEEEEDDDDDDDDGDEDDDDDDVDDVTTKKNKQNAAGNVQNPADCKQQ